MASIRLAVKNLEGWEDPPRVVRILEALPSVDEATVDPASGQAWARGRGHLPLLGMLEALHSAGFEAEPATDEILFPTIIQDERTLLTRLRASLLWTLSLLVLDIMSPSGPWSLAAGMALVLAFLFTTARMLWMPALKTLRLRPWSESLRTALALWLLVASLPLAWQEGSRFLFALPALVAVFLLLSQWLELRWRRILKSDLPAGDESPGFQNSLGKAPDIDGPLRRLGNSLAWVLPVMALVWIILGLLLPAQISAGGMLRGLAAILLAGGSRGLILATSSVMAAGLVRSASKGMIFSSAGILERFHRARILGFDRVGFLTRSQAEVETVKIFGSHSAERIYGETAGALAGATHPLIRALYRFAADRAESEIHPLSVIRRPGGGLEAEIAGRTLLVGHFWFLEREGVDLDEARETVAYLSEQGLSTLVLSVDGHARAVFGLRVDPRPEAPSLVRRLRAMGLRPLLLTGEGERLALREAERQGIEEVHSGLDSEERARVLREKGKGEGDVAAVGLGSHDAPVLAAADFPISLGSDAPLGKPGLVLRSGRPGAVLDALAFSRLADSLTRQNVWLAGGLVLAALLLAFSGLLGPLACTVLRVIAFQAPLANSLRIRSFRFESSAG